MDALQGILTVIPMQVERLITLIYFLMILKKIDAFLFHSYWQLVTKLHLLTFIAIIFFVTGTQPVHGFFLVFEFFLDI